ncbi:MAG: hypothetical protein PHE29_12510 [Tissierellia bacterium]|nr:hypothetical protein [Tissierellia bacterium]
MSKFDYDKIKDMEYDPNDRYLLRQKRLVKVLRKVNNAGYI